jgi:hypothetical protein
MTSLNVEVLTDMVVFDAMVVVGEKRLWEKVVVHSSSQTLLPHS